MKQIEHLISDNSNVYDLELLKKELDIIKKTTLNNSDMIELFRRYVKEHGEKVNLFESEFKFLNEYNYMLLKNIKSSKVANLTEDLYSLAVQSEKQVLKNLKDTLQAISNEKEKTIRTYELLIETIKKIIRKDGVFIKV